MINILLAVVALFFPVPKGAQAPSTRPHAYTLNHKAIEQAKHFTVLISVENFGMLGRGTGVLIDPTHVLTCFHVANNPGDIWIYTYKSAHLYKAKRIYPEQEKDLAILELDKPMDGPYAVFNSTVTDGEPITIIGNIMGAMQWFVGYGVISTTYGPYLLTDGLVLGGDSGGPWINEAGEVVAISDFGFIDKNDKPTGVNGGVSAATILTFLNDWKHPKSLFQMLLGG